ncbi:MAG: ACT domain-containing protein [Methanomassiliicoccales archaeon]|nr:ACT domain-containing protein [Methanomassiliicoccales archaeon]MDD1755608.1 ACT domain-containing protein [Methanomassiliicoccales archaeon]
MRRKDLIQVRGIGFRVHQERFEIVLASPTDEVIGAFALIDYRGERTVVRALRDDESAFGRRTYRMISFIGDLDLDLVGFMALVSEAMADLGIPIFVISSYRTDHVLVLDKDAEKGVEALESLGMVQRA